MDEIIIKALFAGIGLSFITGVLGSFVIWKKMSYFGDSLSHSALLGVAVGFLINIDIHISILLTAILFAILLSYLQSKKILETDNLLGILAHGGLAIGLILMSFVDKGEDFELHHFLFGDIFVLKLKEIYYIYIVLLIIYFLIWTKWHKLLLITISRDLAESYNISYFKHQLLFVFLIAITVSVTVKIVGIFLITSMLIVPPACARYLAKSPLQMSVFAVIISIISVILGILFAHNYQLPSGPSIIVIAISIFTIITIAKTCKK